MQGQFQMLITLNDRDVPDTDDLIDRVSLNTTLLPSNNFTRRTLYGGFYGIASMELSFRVMCHEHYYGPTCNTLCVPRNSSEGHYTCNKDGNIVCLAGYTNTSTNCTTPICKSLIR